MGFAFGRIHVGIQKSRVDVVGQVARGGVQTFPPHQKHTAQGVHLSGNAQNRVLGRLEVHLSDEPLGFVVELDEIGQQIQRIQRSRFGRQRRPCPRYPPCEPAAAAGRGVHVFAGNSIVKLLV